MSEEILTGTGIHAGDFRQMLPSSANVRLAS